MNFHNKITINIHINILMQSLIIFSNPRTISLPLDYQKYYSTAVNLQTFLYDYFPLSIQKSTTVLSKTQQETEIKTQKAE